MDDQYVFLRKMKNCSKSWTWINASNVEYIIIYRIKTANLMIISTLTWGPTNNKSPTCEHVFQVCA